MFGLADPMRITNAFPNGLNKFPVDNQSYKVNNVKYKKTNVSLMAKPINNNQNVPTSRTDTQI